MNEGIEGQKDDDLQIVTFRVGEEEFSVSILKVQEIIRMSDITKVPRSPEFVEGVINLRGKVIPVIDLRKRFGLEVAERNNDTRTIVVDCEGKIVGLIVDSVSEVMEIDKENIEPPPRVNQGAGSRFIQGLGKVGKEVKILLEVQKILLEDEMEMIADSVPDEE